MPNKKSMYKFEVKSDTGANCNIMPLRVLRMIFKDLSDESIVKLFTPSSSVLTAVNGTLMYPMGKYYAKCRFGKSRWLSCKFYVVSTEGPAIFPCSDSIGLGIITVAKSDLISPIANK